MTHLESVPESILDVRPIPISMVLLGGSDKALGSLVMRMAE